MADRGVVGRVVSWAVTQALRAAAGLLATPADLHILIISLDVESDRPEVTFDLEIKSNLRAAPLRSIKKWRYPTSTFDVPDELLPGQQDLGKRPPLPPDLVQELNSHLPAAPRTPLWIKFGPVAGYLRLVPWDALLRADLDRPILRLIDLESPPPREFDPSLNVVLCASEPRAKSPFSEVSLLPTIARKILEANTRQKVQVHVFADSEHYDELKARLADLGSRVSVYQPSQAVTAHPDRKSGDRGLPSEISNAWLRWIAQSLRRSVDVVHFVCHGYLTAEQGWLALAETPLRNVDEEWSRFIGSADLDQFLVHVGAWSMVFSSPPGNFSPAGLRLLANQMSEDRCRSALLHDLAADAKCAQLTDAYRFLYHPGPDHPPNGSALSIYCHPSLVKVGTVGGSLARRAADALPALFGFTFPEDVTDSVANGVDRALRKFEELGGVPPWLATAQRYVEQRKLELRLLERQVASGDTEELQQIQEAKAVLAKIEKTTVSLANQSDSRA
jgi:hypothetical protein